MMLEKKLSLEEACAFMQKRGCVLVIPVLKTKVFHRKPDGCDNAVGVYDEKSGILKYCPETKRELNRFLGKPKKLMDSSAFMDLSW